MFMNEAKHETKKYSCPMHPEVQQDKLGNCSKCGMNLIEKGMEKKKASCC